MDSTLWSTWCGQQCGATVFVWSKCCSNSVLWSKAYFTRLSNWALALVSSLALLSSDHWSGTNPKTDSFARASPGPAWNVDQRKPTWTYFILISSLFLCQMQTRVRAGFNLTEISWLVFDSSILPVIGCLAQPLLYHSSHTYTIPTPHLPHQYKWYYHAILLGCLSVCLCT